MSVAYCSHRSEGRCLLRVSPCCPRAHSDPDGWCPTSRLWGHCRHVSLLVNAGLVVQDPPVGCATCRAHGIVACPEHGPPIDRQERYVTCTDAVRMGVPEATVRIAHWLPTPIIDRDEPPDVRAWHIARVRMNLSREDWESGRARARESGWIMCAHTLSEAPCDYCAAVMAEFRARGYVTQVHAQVPRQWARDGEYGWKSIVIDTPEHAQRALGRIAVGLPFYVWRKYYLPVQSYEQGSPVLSGVWSPWPTREFTARCFWPKVRGLSSDTLVDSHMAAKLAASHLREGVCECGIYGMYNWLDVMSQDLWHNVGRYVQAVWLGECEPDGVVMFGSRGVRASEMRMVRLYCIAPDARDREQAERVAEHYGVPVWCGTLREFLLARGVTPDHPLGGLCYGGE